MAVPWFDGLFGATQASEDDLVVDGQGMGEFLNDDCKYNADTKTVRCGDTDDE